MTFDLFPAYAGVILAQAPAPSVCTPFPRIRGVIPTPGCVPLALYSFLRMCVESLIFTNSCARINIELEELCAHVAFAVGRGCQPFARLVAFFLFPAHAGVISLAAVIGLCSSSETFSPHMRG